MLEDEMLNALGSQTTRKILKALPIKNDIGIQELCKLHPISQSTAYKNIHLLEKAGLIQRSKYTIANDGKKTAHYKRSVSKLKLIAVINNETISFSII